MIIGPETLRLEHNGTRVAHLEPRWFNHDHIFVSLSPTNAFVISHNEGERIAKLLDARGGNREEVVAKAMKDSTATSIDELAKAALSALDAFDKKARSITVHGADDDLMAGGKSFEVVLLDDGSIEVAGRKLGAGDAKRLAEWLHGYHAFRLEWQLARDFVEARLALAKPNRRKEVADDIITYVLTHHKALIS